MEIAGLFPFDSDVVGAFGLSIPGILHDLEVEFSWVGDGEVLSDEEGLSVVEFTDERSGHECSSFAWGVISFRGAFILSYIILGPEVNVASGGDNNFGRSADGDDLFPVCIGIHRGLGVRVAVDMFDMGHIDGEFS